MSIALHIGQQKHQPWCRIFHQPAMTTECWCDAQIAITAYKLGVAEGAAMAVLKMRHDEMTDEPRSTVSEQADEQDQVALSAPVERGLP